MSGVWRPGDPVDLAWRGIGYIRAYLRMDIPDAALIRRALRQIATISPQVGRWCHPDGHWRPVGEREMDAWLDLHVFASPLHAIAPELAFTLPPHLRARQRFSVMVGDDWLLVTADHEFGDGLTVDTFVGHLLRQARSEETLELPWRVATAWERDRDIAAGLLRNARSLPYVVRHRRELAGGSYAIDEQERTPTTVVALSDLRFTAAVRHLRDRLYPDASMAAIVIAGIRAGLARCVAEVRPGFECLYNSRRPHAGLPLWGNWSAGLYVRPHDDHDPVAISEAMVEVRDRGLPAYALAAMRARGRHTIDTHAPSAAATGAPRLTVSYFGQHTVAMLPGVRPGESLIATFSHPNGPDSISVQAVELGGRLSLSAAFNPEVWPRNHVQEALRDFLASPERVLFSPSRHQSTASRHQAS
ncbi:MAG: hypothetical protein ACXVWW_07395 [Nocardioides sp.]